MVSYDDHEEVQSDLNSDFSVFDKPDNEWASIQTMEDEETLVDCQAEATSSHEEGMEVAIESQGVAPSRVFNMDPILDAVHTPMMSRSPSPVSSVAESETETLYNPSPSPGLRPTRARLAKRTSLTTLFSRSPTPLVGQTSSPAPSSFSASSSVVKVKVEREYKGPNKSKKKRSSKGSRKGEPRRCQNMIAQKRYRDKKVQASALMSDTLVDIKAGLKYASPNKRLEMILSLVDAYDANMRDLDPNLAAKQDQAVKDHALRFQ